MWRDAHVPRVSRCAYSGETPGNGTENPPSSPPCRDWPDCLAVGGVRSEPVSANCRAGSWTWPDLAGPGIPFPLLHRWWTPRLPTSSCAPVGAHLGPRPLQDIAASDLVVERVESSLAVGLGRPVKRSLQISDSVSSLGGPSQSRHSPALPCLERVQRSRGPALPAGYVVPAGRRACVGRGDAMRLREVRS